MRIAVIGSRNCGEINEKHIIQYIPLNCSEIVSGGAQGVDCLAKQAADKLHVSYTEFKPNYERFGKCATLKRNLQIVEYVDLVLAFWDGVSKGTAYTIDQCIKSHKPFKIIRLSDLG